MPPPIPLASLRLSPRDADDLRWLLLRDYEGDLGVRSPLGLQLDAARAAVPRRPSRHPHAVYVPSTHEPRRIVDLSDDIIAAATRLRRLRARWLALPAEHQHVLAAVYGATRLPLPEWGDLGPLVLESPVARRAYARTKASRSLDAWLSRLPARAAASSLTAEIRREAETRLVAACRAWEHSWRAAA